jgi:predicted RNase H-like HicB family nuclease
MANGGIMSFPIFIHQDSGQYTAHLLGAPDVHVSAPTRREALARMQAALELRYAAGELVFLNVPDRQGAMAFAGQYADDESLQEICDEIYRQRDAEPKE